MKLDFSQVKAERLAKYHNLSGFDCGDKDINDFIKNDALGYQDKKLATTTIFIYEDTLIGFFSASADSLKLIPPEKKEHELEDKPIQEFQTIKIARLGRYIKYKDMKVGENILKWAIGYIIECSQMVAVRFVTVDAYPNKVVWYEEFGLKRNEDRHYIKRTKHVSMRYDLFNGIPK